MVTPIFSTDMSFGGGSILTVAEPEDEINENKPISVFSIAKKYGLKDIFIADKTLSGLVESYNVCEKNNLNLRVGYKVICCNNIKDKSEQSFSSEHKIIIWLNHSDGYKNFIKLVSKIQTDGFYYIPRADCNLLKEFWSEHLSISIPFYDSFLHKNTLEFGQCLPDFPARPTFFLESNDLPFDEILRQKVLDYTKNENCEVLETKSVYYYKEEDYKAYLTNKCINNRSTLDKPEFRHNCSNTFSFESARNLGLDTSNSSKFTQSFSKLELPFFGIRLPHIQVEDRIKEKIGVSKESSNYTLLKSLCREGFLKRKAAGQIKEEEIEWYRNQCVHELKTLKTLGFVDYILIVWDMVNFCLENNIPIGRGRGSAAGSSVLYLLGITDIPVKRHGLLFERFLSADRAATIEKNGIQYLQDSPDVDQDISRNQRYKVVDYLNKKYPGQTSKIINISTLQGKVLIKEVAKCVDNCEQSELNLITNLIPVEFGNVADIERVYKEIPEFKEWCDKYPESYKISLKLRGLAKNKSIHASGYLVTHCNIDEFIPTELTADKQLVRSFDMYSAGTIAVKLDLLGLKTLDILDGASKLCGIDFVKINIDDPSIYQYLCNPAAPFMGIFQAEEGLGEKTLRRIKPNNIDNIIDSIAIGRPGAFRYTDDYCDFKEGVKFPKIDPRVEDILGPTGGLLLYQEQLQSLSVRMGGFTAVESGGIRKAVGKKIKEKMLSYKEKFIKGSLENKYSKEYIDDIWQTFENSADYSFNKCLSPDTVVETSAGFKMMFECERGEKIKAFNTENEQDHFVEIEEIYENEVELYEVELKDGRKIKASLKHKFLCEDMKMHALEKIIKKKLRIITD